MNIGMKFIILVPLNIIMAIWTIAVHEASGSVVCTAISLTGYAMLNFGIAGKNLSKKMKIILCLSGSVVSFVIAPGAMGVI